MTKYIASKNIQFSIIIYLPKTTTLPFTDFYQRLENGLKAYQDSFDSNMYWYLSKNTIRAKQEELVYCPEGFTDFGMKKLALAYQKIEKNNDTQIFFIDGEPTSIGQVITYNVDKSFFDDALISSNIDFFFTKLEDLQLLKQITTFVTKLANVFTDSYIEIDLMERVEAIFPKRIGTSLLVYIPVPLNAKDYPEAHKIIPINQNDKQVGTVIVSLDHFPFFKNIEDVKTMNRLDVRLREADLLPERSNL
ncbi:Imm52 family immunity protein [Gilliamella bombi]|uniref:Imm52 family immunity protein n=1 Tax=Gilliamella bombi TaxID=1908521 RepID=UPI000A151382|nr:Imm52 family immunity protein [Gilliamella bombi]